MKRLSMALMLGTLLCVAATPARAARIRVMILDGESAGPYHNWRLTTPVLKEELEETGLFDVTVVTAPPSSENLGNFHPDFGKYQAIVMNYDAEDWPQDLRTQFEQYVRDGGGLVIVHAADNAFPNWPAYNQMIGIGGWRHRTEADGPLLVLQGRQAGFRSVTRPHRLAWCAAAVSGGDARPRQSHHEGPAARVDACQR